MTAALLDVRIQHKSHGPRTVLSDIDFSVEPGEIVALLGASGCGKSTLLRLIAGLDAQYKGNIRHDANRTGFVFQEPRLMPWLTVADNVGFALGRGRGNDRKVRDLLEEVGLSHAAQYFPKQLSGGMAQRAALARALVSEADLLLLDEPFSALDVLTRGRLHRLVRDLVRKYQVGAVFVTHDPDEAIALSNKVLVLDATPGPFRERILIPDNANDAARLALREKIISALSLPNPEIVF